jgi:hypothetical protein
MAMPVWLANDKNETANHLKYQTVSFVVCSYY